MKTSLSALAALLLLIETQAASTQQLLDQLRTSANSELEAQKPEDPKRSHNLTELVELIQGLGKEPDPETLQRVLNFIDRTEFSPEIKAQAEVILLQLQRDAEETEGAALKPIEENGRRLARQIFEAKAARALDPYLEEIEQMLTQTRMPRRRTEIAGAQLMMRMEALNRLQRFARGWQDYLLAIESADLAAAHSALRNLSANAAEVPWLPRSEVMKSLQKAQKDLLGPIQEQIEKFAEEITTKALAAKEAGELDSLHGELSRYQQQMGRRGYDSEGNRPLESAGEFVRRWQEYLSARASNNVTRGREILNQLARDNREWPGVSRATLLALANKEESAKEAKPTLATVLNQIHSLEDLKEKLPQLEKFPYPERGPEFENTLNALRQFSRAYLDFKHSSANVSIPKPTSETEPEILLTLRREFQLLWLSRKFPENPPKSEETPAEYFNRLAHEAKQNKDWAMVARILEAGPSTGLEESKTNDRSAMSYFLTGLNSEKAEQFAMAALYFQLALKTNSELIPLETIGMHLKQIEKDHPKEYEAALQWAMSAATTPISPYDPRTRVYPPVPAPPYSIPQRSGATAPQPRN